MLSIDKFPFTVTISGTDIDENSRGKTLNSRDPVSLSRGNDICVSFVFSLKITLPSTFSSSLNSIIDAPEP